MSVQLQSVFQKPDRTYAYLIWAAINATDDKMATVVQLYQYFIENYDFYKFSPDAHVWKRAIREKLCSDPCFFRIDPDVIGGLSRERGFGPGLKGLHPIWPPPTLTWEARG
ncbi:hypothetical protein FKM82_017482 [Ascaphus truei]